MLIRLFSGGVVAGDAVSVSVVRRAEMAEDRPPAQRRDTVTTWSYFPGVLRMICNYFTRTVSTPCVFYLTINPTNPRMSSVYSFLWRRCHIFSSFFNTKTAN